LAPLNREKAGAHDFSDESRGIKGKPEQQRGEFRR